MKNTEATHTIRLVADASNDVYCGECGRNVTPIGKTPVIGTWPVGNWGPQGGHKSTSTKLIADRLA